jgi:hypothetical protein
VFVLRYKRESEFLAVILDGISVAHVRLAASFLEPGTFLEGRRLDEVSAARLPQWAVGRVLTQWELAALAAGKKKRPAPSVARRGRSLPSSPK